MKIGHPRVRVLVDPPGRKKTMAKILLMEDEADQSHLFATGMENMGHHVVCAGGGAEALDLLKTEAFELLVTDIFVRKDGVLVNDGGLALISRIRNQAVGSDFAHLRKLPVLVISGGIQMPGQANLFGISSRLGANAALGKPVDFAHLEKVIDALLSGEPIPDPPPPR